MCPLQFLLADDLTFLMFLGICLSNCSKTPFLHVKKFSNELIYRGDFLRCSGLKYKIIDLKFLLFK